MAWQITGQSMEMCSCEMMCPCWFGPDWKPDQEWCGSAFGFEVRQGSSDGVELGGTKVALMAYWPGNFFAGDGTARLYIDESASDDQRRELEAIFSGNKGGHLEGLWGAVFKDWLPAQATKVDITWGDSPTLTVDGVGQGTLAPITNGAGQPTRVTGAMAQAGFQIDGMDMASSKGSQWSPPDMQSWQGDSGTLHDTFNWSA